MLFIPELHLETSAAPIPLEHSEPDRHHVPHGPRKHSRDGQVVEDPVVHVQLPVQQHRQKDAWEGDARLDVAAR